MKTCILYLFILVFLSISCEKESAYNQEKYSCNMQEELNPNLPNAAKLEQLMNDLLAKGTTGVALMIETPQGTWYGSKGMSDIASHVDMQPCNMFRIGSVTKMFTSVTILRLYEEGKLSLDDKISNYLPKEMIDKIDGANEATISDLLSHRSRIRNYIELGYMLDAFNMKYKKPSPDDLIPLIYGKKKYSEVTYSNTNYLLLGKIISKIEGKSAYEVIKEKIIQPLGLTNTFVGNEIPEGMVKSYADVYDNGKIVEATDIDNNVIGGDDMTDGGIISNASDLITFFKAISKGILLDQKTFALMSNCWDIPKQPSNKYLTKYGLGLMQFDTPYGVALGHGGDVFGFHAILYYFPERDIYFSCLVNGQATAASDNLLYGEKFFDYLF